MDQRETHLADEEHKFVVVREEYLVDIVKALKNLTPGWTYKLKNGSLKLQFAVQIGRKLDKEKQLRFMEFASDTNVQDKYMGKVLHAFALEMPEWSIQTVLHIYKLAEKTKAAIVMYNDLMDEYETLFQKFEYDFLEGEFPTEHEQLERTLSDVESGFQGLYNQAPVRERTDYNRFYGDSSSTSSDHETRQGETSFLTMIGVAEDAPQDEIRRQSRRLLKKLHPDRGGSAYLFSWVKKEYDAHLSNNSNPGVAREDDRYTNKRYDD